MRRIIKTLLLLSGLIALTLALTLLLVLSDSPIVNNVATLTPNDIARAKQLFHQNDPRLLQSGEITTVAINQADVALAANYAANQFLGGFINVRLESERALIQGSLPFADMPFDVYLNLQLELEQGEHLPNIATLSLGELPVPVVLAEWLLKTSLAQSRFVNDWHSLQRMLKQVEFRHQQLAITYRWQNNLPTHLSGVFLSSSEQERIAVYQQYLAKQVQRAHTGLSLTVLTQSLFQLASTRSIVGSAIAENQAAILVLAFYVNQKTFYKLLPQASQWSFPVWRQVTLSGRDDFAKHYIISALLAAYAGTPLADAVGIYKEVEDSQGGSGFSFNDIAADRAGTRLGELAVHSPAQARQLQQQLLSAEESDLMPETADLPEFMAESEFKRRFGGLHAKAYQNMLSMIEQRIAALPINP